MLYGLRACTFTRTVVPLKFLIWANCSPYRELFALGEAAPVLAPACPVCGKVMTVHRTGNFYECPNWFTAKRCAQVCELGTSRPFPRRMPVAVRPVILPREAL